jgi:hypothetical protein
VPCSDLEALTLLFSLSINRWVRYGRTNAGGMLQTALHAQLDQFLGWEKGFRGQECFPVVHFQQTLLLV